VDGFEMLTVRPADRGERSALEELQVRASVAVEEYREVILANRDAIELPLEQIVDGRVAVAERDGRVVGFSVLLPRDDGEAELDGLFVEPDVWRQGIGARLIRDTERRAFLDAARWLHVVANPRAEAFYSACGFEFAAEVPTRFGIARTMRKALTG
jgi:GNAT superfamily N-acetyltransferase